MRDGQFTTTYRRDISRLWCNYCGNSTVVEDRRVTDELLDRHVCAEPGSPWDGGHETEAQGHAD